MCIKTYSVLKTLGASSNKTEYITILYFPILIEDMKFNLNISLSNISLQLLLPQRSKLDNFVIEEKCYQNVMVLSMMLKDPLSWTPSNNMLKKIMMISFQHLENVQQRPKSVQTTGILLGVTIKCYQFPCYHSLKHGVRW